MRVMLLAFLVAFRFLASEAQAQGAASPEALAAANELAAVLSQDTITQLSRAMTATIWARLEAEIGSKVDRATLDELRAEFEKSLAAFVTDAMKEAPTIYARYFTAEELRGMTAFYRTPAGTKALQLMPQVMGDFYATLMPRMETFQRQLQDIVQAVLRKHGYQQ